MVSVKRMHLSDCARVARMIQTTVKQSYADLFPKKLIVFFVKKYTVETMKIRMNRGPFWIAIENEKIIGCIALVNNEMRTFFVHPKYQKKGVGSALYKRFLKEVKQKNIKKIYLDASPVAESIYAHWEFKKIRRIPRKDAGITYSYMRMVKKIS